MVAMTKEPGQHPITVEVILRVTKIEEIKTISRTTDITDLRASNKEPSTMLNPMAKATQAELGSSTTKEEAETLQEAEAEAEEEAEGTNPTIDKPTIICQLVPTNRGCKIRSTSSKTL